MLDPGLSCSESSACRLQLPLGIGASLALSLQLGAGCFEGGPLLSQLLLGVTTLASIGAIAELAEWNTRRRGGTNEHEHMRALSRNPSSLDS